METWHYQENQFDNATKENFKRMNIINADHQAKLQAQAGEPDISALLARTTPLYDGWNTAYSAWLSAKAVYKGETSRVEGYVDELRKTKIKQWDAQIQVVFLEETPDYIAILPNGRKPFNSGTMDDRISHLLALGERLNNYPALIATRNDVNAFYAVILGARSTQQQKEELVENASDLLEAARFALAVLMYRNLGFLMDKYGATPEFISNFWELSLLRAPVSDDDQTVSGRCASNGNPLPAVKVTLKDAEGAEAGEPVLTDENGSYLKSTAHFGPGTLEFEKAGFQNKTVAVVLPEGGSLVQDAELMPV